MSIEETARIEQEAGNVFCAGIGWISQKALDAANVFIEAQDDHIVRVQKYGASGLQIDFVSRAYGWGEPKTLVRFF